jgi:DNA-directed RNA polymerase specialized sigma24 family protein
VSTSCGAVPPRIRSCWTAWTHCWRRFPKSQREVIEMLKVAGMSLEEVARATSSTVGSVKQKVHRAYKKLRETMSATGSGRGKAEDCRER